MGMVKTQGSIGITFGGRVISFGQNCVFDIVMYNCTYMFIMGPAHLIHL